MIFNIKSNFLIKKKLHKHMVEIATLKLFCRNANDQ